MWPFSTRKRRLEKAISEASEETRNLLTTFLVSDRDRLITIMVKDPYVCGYIIGRTLGVAAGHSHRNRLVPPDDAIVWHVALQHYFEDRCDEVMAVANASRTDESSKDRFRAGSRDVALLALYMSGQSDIRDHPEFDSIFEVLRKADQNLQYTNPYFPLAYENMRFDRYLREHFPASRMSQEPGNGLKT